MRLCLFGPLRQLLLLALLYLKVVCVLCDNFCGALGRAARALLHVRSLYLSLSVFLCWGETQRCGTCASESALCTHTHMYVSTHVSACMYALSCSVIVRERRKKSASQRPNAHSIALSFSLSRNPNFSCSFNYHACSLFFLFF